MKRYIRAGSKVTLKWSRGVWPSQGWVTLLCVHVFIDLEALRTSYYWGFMEVSWRRKRLPTPVFLPGKSHGQRSLGSIVHGAIRLGDWTWLGDWTTTTMKVSSSRHDQSFTPSSVFSLLKRIGSQGWKFQASSHAWSFWWPASNSRASSPPRVSSFKQKMLLVLSPLRNLQGF